MSFDDAFADAFADTFDLNGGSGGGWAAAQCVLEEVPDITEAEAVVAIESATWALWTLTGKVFHLAGCWAEDFTMGSGCKVRLGMKPLTEIVRVERISGCAQPNDWTAGTEMTGWCLIDAQTLDVCPGGPGTYRNNWGVSGGTCGRPSRLRVIYSAGEYLPPGTEAVVCRLASEYAKAAAGKSCSLPERVTNITRQGVTWSVLDPQTFFEKGMIGIGQIDHWIHIARMYAGAGTMYDPLNGRSVRRTRIECAALPDEVIPIESLVQV